MEKAKIILDFILSRHYNGKADKLIASS
jgi:hypothetical protein